MAGNFFPAGYFNVTWHLTMKLFPAKISERVTLQSLWRQRVTVVVYLPFTKISGKSGWKVNGTRPFRSSQRKISGSDGTSEKVVLFFPMEYSKQKFVFHFFKAIIGISLTTLRPFSGKKELICTVVNAIPVPEQDLPVLNFANHLPKPWTDLFTNVNGKQPVHCYPRMLTALISNVSRETKLNYSTVGCTRRR